MAPLPRFLPGGLAFVDIETTGGSAQRESITEIGIIEVDDGDVREWSSLVRPGMRIPEHIARLTGISNEMVAAAPSFAEIAAAVFDRLDGRLFIAHNARFDHGYLRAAFRRVGMDLRPQVLCTVKLSRRLFAEHRRHSLDHLIARHGLTARARHRALGDAQVLWQFWQLLYGRFPPHLIEAAVRAAIGRPTLPQHLDADALERIPAGPGVYLFYGENDLPLYIGKSRHLRERVLAHFRADRLSDRALDLSQQVRRIEWIESAGELGALLTEANLIKRLQPTHNLRLRRNADAWAWRLAPDLLGDWRLELVPVRDLDFTREDALYGLFRSRHEAVGRMRALAHEHALCPPLLGLERVPRGRCFTFQVKHCLGACHGEEALQAHTQRLLGALRTLKVQPWPFAGPATLREGRSVHVVDRWRFLGTAGDGASVAEILARTRLPFDPDVYRVLVRVVARAEPLPPQSSTAHRPAAAHGTRDADVTSPQSAPTAIAHPVRPEEE